MTIKPTEKPKLSMQSGANLTELKKQVKTITDGISTQKRKRQEINDQIASYRSKLETLGIHKKAADMAMAYMSWEPEKREGFDIAYAIVREAMGLPVSDDLFAAADEQERQERQRAQQAEADAVFAEKAGLGGVRDEGKIADVTASELKEGEDVFKTKPGEKAAIGEETPPSKKPGKLEPIVGDDRASSHKKAENDF